MTIQTSEILKFNEDIEFNLSGNVQPLRPYLENKRLQIRTSNMISSNWRGYKGSWGITDRQLYLHHAEDIDGKSLMHFLGFDSEPIKADWFSGTLRFESGEVTDTSPSLGDFLRFGIEIEIFAGQVTHFSIRDCVESLTLESTQIPLFLLRYCKKRESD